MLLFRVGFGVDSGGGEEVVPDEGADAVEFAVERARVVFVVGEAEVRSVAWLVGFFVGFFFFFALRVR